MNYKHQSHDAKYVCGLPAVKTCYVFAIINTIVVFLAVLGWLGLLFYLLATFGLGPDHTWDGSEVIITALWLAAIYIAAAIAAVFAILLLAGIRKKKPKLVKAYFFYGVVVEILLIGALVLGTAIYFKEILRGDGLIHVTVLGCICVIYGFVLRLVMNTYLVLRGSQGLHSNGTEVQALFMLGPNGELQVLPLAQ